MSATKLENHQSAELAHTASILAMQETWQDKAKTVASARLDVGNDYIFESSLLRLDLIFLCIAAMKAVSFLLFPALLYSTLVQATPLPGWLTNLVPHAGSNIQDEIKCYSLPYGGIGFLSHFLTYYVILCVTFLRRPYFPFYRLSYGWTDVVLSILQLLGTMSIAIFTMIRCRQSWQFVLIAVWRLGLSLTVGWWSLYASLITIAAGRDIVLFDGVLKFFKITKNSRRFLFEKGSDEFLNTIDQLRNDILVHRQEIEGRPARQATVDAFLPQLQRELRSSKIHVQSSRILVPRIARLKRDFRESIWAAIYLSRPTNSDEDLTVRIRQARAGVIDEMLRLYQLLHSANLKTTYRLTSDELPNAEYLSIYIVFCVIGITGHAGLIARATQTDTVDHGKLQAVNLGFGFLIAGVTLLMVIGLWIRALAVWIPGCVFVLTAFWSDWVLGVIANDMTGIPSGDIWPLYWAYFLAKRLPMLLS